MNLESRSNLWDLSYHRNFLKLLPYQRPVRSSTILEYFQKTYLTFRKSVNTGSGYEFGDEFLCSVLFRHQRGFDSVRNSIDVTQFIQCNIVNTKFFIFLNSFFRKSEKMVNLRPHFTFKSTQGEKYSYIIIRCSEQFPKQWLLVKFGKISFFPFSESLDRKFIKNENNEKIRTIWIT